LLRVLLTLHGGFWVVGGVLAVSGVVDFGLSSGVQVLGTLMLANGAALLLAAQLSLRGRSLIDYSVAALLALNGVLSITDEIGLLDVASLIVSGFGLVLLLLGRRQAHRVEPAD
jgi:hypothetical protein